MLSLGAYLPVAVPGDACESGVGWLGDRDRSGPAPIAPGRQHLAEGAVLVGRHEPRPKPKAADSCAF